MPAGAGKGLIARPLQTFSLHKRRRTTEKQPYPIGTRLLAVPPKLMQGIFHIRTRYTQNHLLRTRPNVGRSFPHPLHFAVTWRPRPRLLVFQQSRLTGDLLPRLPSGIAPSSGSLCGLRWPRPVSVAFIHHQTVAINRPRTRKFLIRRTRSVMHPASCRFDIPVYYTRFFLFVKGFWKKRSLFSFYEPCAIMLL